MPRIGRWIALAVLVGSTFGCDRVTKHFAAVSLAGRDGESYLGDTVRLQYAENAGAFLSLGENLPPQLRTGIFTFGTAVVLLGTVFMAVRLEWSGPPIVGLALVFAGGASNLLDRVAHGTVIDFLNVGVGSVRTGIFNVADVAIMAGVALLLVTRGRAVSPAAGSEDPASI